MKKLVDSHHGMLWEVPLTQNLGFAYVQTICLAEFREIGTLVKVLSFRNNMPYTNNNISFFEQFDFLSTPILGINPPPQRGENKWRKLGYLPLQQEDLTCQEFTSPSPFIGYPDYTKCLWAVYRGTSLDSQFEDIRFNYEQVKHLSFIDFTNLRFISHRITMEWMKYLRMDYEKYETEDSPSYINIKDQKYFVKCGVNYLEVPKEIRGRAIRN